MPEPILSNPFSMMVMKVRACVIEVQARLKVVACRCVPKGLLNQGANRVLGVGSDPVDDVVEHASFYRAVMTPCCDSRRIFWELP